MSARGLISKVCEPLTQAWYGTHPGTRILMYHRVNDLGQYDQLTVTPERFEAQLAWMQQHKRMVSMDAALANFNQPNQVVLTFDDGYLDNLTKALPLLEKYQAPALIYVTTDFADQSVNHKRYPNEAERLHLNWDELKELVRHPLISLGSHTVSHPFLQRISPEQLIKEVAHSKALMEDYLGVPCDHFCYPAGDHSDREVFAVQEAGYKTATTVSPGQNRNGINPLRLKRTEITDKDDAAQLAAKLKGAYDPMHQILDIKRKRTFAKQAY